MSTVVNVIKGIHEHYVVEVDGQRFDGQFTMICACNGKFYGGGFCPVPAADPTDGKLEVLLVTKVSRLQVLNIIGKYKNGRYKELSNLVRYFKTDSVKITCDKPSPIQLDGELHTAQVVQMQVADKKLRFFYPKALSFAAKEPVHT